LNTTQVQKTIAVSVALTYLLSGMGVAARTVLCIGTDGHVAIEFAEDGICTSFSGENADNSSTGLAAQPTVPTNRHCGSCIDIPLGTGEVAKQPVVHRKSLSADVYLVTESRLVAVGSRTAYACRTTAEAPSSTNWTLTCLRTVCLLT